MNLLVHYGVLYISDKSNQLHMLDNLVKGQWLSVIEIHI